MEGADNLIGIPVQEIPNLGYSLDELKPSTYLPRDFGKDIELISIDFVKIFNQSAQAEELGLDEIAGPGFRKALEFLIKDYAILRNPSKEQEITKSLLGSVIASYVDDNRIVSTAKRAAWLGNDEPHYYRRWKDQDINDMKKLMELTVR